MKPGLHFIVVRHDDDCPMLLPARGRCTCAHPVAEELGEEDFARIFAADVMKRRAVAEAARQALDRAKGKP